MLEMQVKFQKYFILAHDTYFKNAYRPLPNYMTMHEDINPKMRCILVDWLSEVIEDFGLATETLHLAINYVDRYLSVKSITRDFLQLLGVSSLMIAS
jgi:cyclin-A